MRETLEAAVKAIRESLEDVDLALADMESELDELPDDEVIQRLFTGEQQELTTLRDENARLRTIVLRQETELNRLRQGKMPL